MSSSLSGTGLLLVAAACVEAMGDNLMIRDSAIPQQDSAWRVQHGHSRAAPTSGSGPGRNALATASRMIEFSFALLVAFVLLVFLSFVSSRSLLREMRADAEGHWVSLLHAVEERNGTIPGLAEALRAVHPGSGRLAEEMLKARAIALRATSPDKIIASVDQLEVCLRQTEKLTESSRALRTHPPFATWWTRTQRSSQRVLFLRNGYNRSVRSYNLLLEAFPQNLLASVFGFVPLSEYPSNGLAAPAQTGRAKDPAAYLHRPSGSGRIVPCSFDPIH